MAECCGNNTCRKTVLLYVCSGGANVAEMADRACRDMMMDGCGTMFCLAGLGAGIDGTIQTAARQVGLDCELVKVADVNEIMKFGVTITPALAVDGEVKMAGKVPDAADIEPMLN
jgi:small redox-active disulfide protein 2